MKLKLTLGVVALLLAPSFAAAFCSSHEQQAMSCAEGTMWDSDTETCVPSVSS